VSPEERDVTEQRRRDHESCYRDECPGQHGIVLARADRFVTMDRSRTEKDQTHQQFHGRPRPDQTVGTGEPLLP